MPNTKKILFAIVLFLLHAAVFSQPAPPYKADLYVTADGSGDYKTIQEAVNAVRDLSDKHVTIHIKNGVYREKLVVPSWKTNITLAGESEENTIITYDDFSGKPVPGGKDGFGRDKFSTYTSYTVLVQGNDIAFENLTIQNTAGRVGQAVALHVEGDRFVAKHCRILGNQDTLYVAKEDSRQYFTDCFIEGTTDFLFGEATVVFENCTIKSLTDSYVTAASTRRNQQYGYVLIGCKLIAAETVKKVFLGRPWRPYAKTVYIHCELGSHISPQGWDPWKGDLMWPEKEKTTLYAEYKNTGAGAGTAERVNWSKQLTDKEAAKYTVTHILSGKDHWTPNPVQQ